MVAMRSSKLEVSDYDLVIIDAQPANVSAGSICSYTSSTVGLNTDLVMTNATSSISEAVAAVKAGAVDYLEKPIDFAH